MNIDGLKEKLGMRVREIDEILSVEPDEWIKEHMRAEKNILRKIIQDRY